MSTDPHLQRPGHGGTPSRIVPFPLERCRPEPRRGDGTDPGPTAPANPGKLVNLPTHPAGPQIVGASPAWHRVLRLVRQAAGTQVAVLLTGEPGTGKQLVARAIHARSARAGQPFVVAACGAAAEHRQHRDASCCPGEASADAVADWPALLAAADGGVLFLGQLAQASAAAQAGLLYLLETGQVCQADGDEPGPVDVRLICATDLCLEDLVDQGQFSRELYSRLCGLVIDLPPLREHPKDIPLLVRHLAPDVDLEPEALRACRAYAWPGNVHELINQLRSAQALAGPLPIGPEHLWPRVRQAAQCSCRRDVAADGHRGLSAGQAVDGPPEDSGQTVADAQVAADAQAAADMRTMADARQPLDLLLEDRSVTLSDARQAFERRLIAARLAVCDGHRTAAARSLGLSRSHLDELLDQLGLGRP